MHIMPFLTSISLFQVWQGDFGAYYCQAVVEGEGSLVRSDELRVNEDYDYSHAYFGDCGASEPLVGSTDPTCAQDGLPEDNLTSSLTYTLTYEPITIETLIKDLSLPSFNSGPPLVTPITLVDGCLYQYTTEPPNQLTCNPYTGEGEPILQSSLLLDTSTSLPAQLLQVVWFYETLDSQEGSSEPLKMFMYTYNPPFGRRTLLTTQLIVSQMHTESVMTSIAHMCFTTKHRKLVCIRKYQSVSLEANTSDKQAGLHVHGVRSA